MLRRWRPRYPDLAGATNFPVFVNLSDQVAATERAIAPEAVALVIFAALAALIALAVIGQLLVRRLALDAADFAALRALGMTRGGLFALSMGRLAVMTACGAIAAAGIAIA